MNFTINQMNQTQAIAVSQWRYEEPFSIYNMDGSDENIEELLDGSYYSVTDSQGDFIGYFCYGKAAQVPVGNQFGAYDCTDMLDIGLGLRPDLCGQGLGADFLSAGLEFARLKFASKNFRLTVASFNQRAAKVYERVGFQKVMSFERISDYGTIEFEVMILHG